MIRLISQVALAMWCVAEGIVLVLSRGHATQTSGVRWALLGLFCFGLWMFLSAITIKSTAIFPRDQVFGYSLTLRPARPIGAWGWLWVNIRQSFRLSLYNGRRQRG